MKKFLYWALTIAPIAYMWLIWELSSIPGDPNAQDTFAAVFKDSLHFIEFGILFWLFAFALAVHGKWTAGTSIAVVAVCLAYGAIDEIHQMFTPFRTSTWYDLFKDAVGITVSYIIMRVTYFASRKSRMHRFFQRLEMLDRRNGM
ncbi:VanZ family protein [Bacillus sp. FJAT-42376]|uniref:VanZ family protein n=1 Tax=Bacillus sp. FJAT-42376 TaxID=2014076 RepID=UPI000F514EDD|nr:VanZ family protein [Bacillus sp. FJAT-42376]AZB40878.1 VanZ family protein [Bacillus sp. FJAT-42376]